MTLTDRHMDELKREQWRSFAAEKDRYLRILARAPRELCALAARAKVHNDILAICAIGEALIQCGGLGLKPLRRIGFVGVLLGVLVAEGRYESALKVFDSLSDTDREWAKVWVARARALAALDDIPGAREAIGRALELDPNVRDGRAFRALLVARHELRSKLKAGLLGWEDLRRLVETHLELGPPGVAARLVKNRLPRLPDPRPEDYADGLRMLQIGLELQGPLFVMGEAGRLAKVRQDDRLKALLVECLIALGRPEEGQGPDEGGRDLRLQRALAAAEAGNLE